MKRLTTCLLLACVGAAAAAHDLHGIFAERAAMTPEAKQRADDVKELRRLLNARVRAGDRDLEAVVQKALRWEKGVLSVCFLDGLEASRQNIAAVANDWTTGTSIRFDFGSAIATRTCAAGVPSDIRVSLNGTGNWSYVGRHAMGIAAEKPTLNLSGMNHGNALTPYDRFLVLHEFGHALGFEHEHQSPEGGCSAEFNWSALPAALGFTEAEVRQNMTRFDESARRSGLVASAFDPSSVMLYALPVEAFHNAATAKCYVAHANSTLSPLDRAGARYLYPVLSNPTGALPHPSVVALGPDLPPQARVILARLRTPAH